MSWALPPQSAIFSGYTMGYAYFQELVLAINPEFATVCRTVTLNSVRSLSKFYDLREKDPDATKFFFPTRAVGAPDDSITEISQSTAHETDLDRTRRDELIDLINRRHRFSVDKRHLRFEAIKDVHPYYAALGVGLEIYENFRACHGSPRACMNVQNKSQNGQNTLTIQFSLQHCVEAEMARFHSSGHSFKFLGQNHASPLGSATEIRVSVSKMPENASKPWENPHQMYEFFRVSRLTQPIYEFPSSY
ncbi:hypothetical protein C8R45DRAFT_929023 [Mycena sanguinolenta]|nr:hypothetical protein C8R45DRAFT_929023 [Mycena sanguinolenta]